MYINNDKKKISNTEKAALSVDAFRQQIKELYRDYPAILATIMDAKIISRSKYNTLSESETPKFGISFENGTSIYVPERLFNQLEGIEVKHLNN